MCGIAGFSGPFDSSSLTRVNQIQQHRGPDDYGSFFDQAAEVGLAHVRLTILELSRLGRQPMQSGNGDVVICFNGEIYNFKEIRAELAQEGEQFRGNSDTEVLLALYMHSGYEMLKRLEGIFAFAIFDRRNHTLFLARDAFGVKPLYYSINPRGFCFASEIKGLLSIIDEPRSLDFCSLFRYLTFLWCPGDGTPIRSIRRLGPGEAMVVKNGYMAKHWQWYQLPVMRMEADAELGPEFAQSEAENLLRAAVHRQLVSDVPVGAFLSGGLDSSAVVAMAREQINEIPCFTIDVRGGSDRGTTDDLPYAREVAAYLKVPLDVITIDSSRMVQDLEKMIYQLDEPLADPAPLNVLYISELARDRGIKVLLSGAGGDDVFSGYRRHVAVALERYWSWLPQTIRRSAGVLTARLDQRVPIARRLTKALSGVELDANSRLINYFSWVAESEVSQLFVPELRAELASQLSGQPMLDFLARVPATTSTLERMLALEQRFFLADHNLIYTDKMSMAAGVEVRVPFLDLELVEFAAKIPPRLKQRGRAGKWILKKTMERHLPNKILNRPKTGFGAPLRRWMKDDLRELLGDMLSAESVKRRGLFEYAAIQRLIQRNYRGQIDASYVLFALLCIEIWCRRFIDQPMAAGFPS